MLDAANVPGINVATADFNGDDILDLAIGLQRGGGFVESVAIQLGLGDGHFQPAEIYFGSDVPNPAQISDVLVGDPSDDLNLITLRRVDGNVGVHTDWSLHPFHVAGPTYLEGGVGIGTIPQEDLHVEGDT